MCEFRCESGRMQGNGKFSNAGLSKYKRRANAEDRLKAEQFLMLNMHLK